MRTKSIFLLAMMCVMAVMNVASADIVQGINVDFVTIGHAGNAGDTRVGANPYGCGAVGYDYRIGKYEVTNAQWNAFTAAAGAPTGLPTIAYKQSAQYTGNQQPTNNVSWFETLQFCNYLTSGDKSKGVYLFSGDNTNPWIFLGVDRATAQTAYGTIYFLPTEDEWYKAAYYKPDGSGYSLYANGTNTKPVVGIDTNYESWQLQPWNIGSGTQEQNGTFDMMGNVFEWNETGNYVRGGSFFYWGSNHVASSYRYPFVFSWEQNDIGFRVASVPESATLILLGLGSLLLKRSKYRKS